MKRKLKHIKSFNESDQINEKLGVTSFRVIKGVSDLLNSFGMSRNSEEYEQMHKHLTDEVKELLKRYDIKVVWNI